MFACRRNAEHTLIARDAAAASAVRAQEPCHPLPLCSAYWWRPRRLFSRATKATRVSLLAMSCDPQSITSSPQHMSDRAFRHDDIWLDLVRTSSGSQLAGSRRLQTRQRVGRRLQGNRAAPAWCCLGARRPGQLKCDCCPEGPPCALIARRARPGCSPAAPPPSAAPASPIATPITSCRRRFQASCLHRPRWAPDRLPHKSSSANFYHLCATAAAVRVNVTHCCKLYNNKIRLEGVFPPLPFLR